MLIQLDQSLKSIPFRDGIEKVRGQNVLKNSPANALMGLFYFGYAYHRSIRVSPDDIWTTILSYFATHVNSEVEYYRPFLADKENPNSRPIILIERSDGFDMNDTESIVGVFDELIREISKKSNVLLPKLTADFTTTTLITRLFSQVEIAKIVESFFGMKLILSCGFPSIEILGSTEDWISMSQKLVGFQEISHPKIKEYLVKCQNVIKKISSNDVEVWKKVFDSQPCGSGSQEDYHGWIFDLINEPMTTPSSPFDMDSTRVCYPFDLIEKETEKQLEIDIGPTGISDDGQYLKIVYDFFYQERKPEGWEFNGQKISKGDISFTIENYSLIRFCGKLIHEMIEGDVRRIEYNVEYRMLIACFVKNGREISVGINDYKKKFKFDYYSRPRGYCVKLWEI